LKKKGFSLKEKNMSRSDHFYNFVRVVNKAYLRQELKKLNRDIRIKDKNQLNLNLQKRKERE
jgi:hypothetical protein